jgi:hypothetical protein
MKTSLVSLYDKKIPKSGKFISNRISHRSRGWGPRSIFWHFVGGKGLLFCFRFCFRDRLSCSPDWPWTCYVAKVSWELLILLPPKCWDYRHASACLVRLPTISLHGTQAKRGPKAASTSHRSTNLNSISALLLSMITLTGYQDSRVHVQSKAEVYAVSPQDWWMGNFPTFHGHGLKGHQTCDQHSRSITDWKRRPCVKKEEKWAGEMAQRLRVLTTLPEVMSSNPKKHMVAHNHL